jgi:TetR/AcrR family transcriptional regulator, tetracycline repressor protein
MADAEPADQSPPAAPIRRAGRPRKHTRTDVLAVAESLLREHGADALSMRRIADELGIAAMSVYTSFGSKQELVDALVADILERHGVAPDPNLPLDRRARGWMYRLRDALMDTRLFEVLPAGASMSPFVPLAAAWHAQLVSEGWPARQAADRASHLMRTVMGYCSTEAGAGQVTRDALDDVVAHLEGGARSEAEAYLANVDVPGFAGLFDLSVDVAVDSLVAASEEYAGR